MYTRESSDSWVSFLSHSGLHQVQHTDQWWYCCLMEVHPWRMIMNWWFCFSSILICLICCSWWWLYWHSLNYIWRTQHMTWCSVTSRTPCQVNNDANSQSAPLGSAASKVHRRSLKAQLAALTPDGWPLNRGHRRRHLMSVPQKHCGPPIRWKDLPKPQTR